MGSMNIDAFLYGEKQCRKCGECKPKSEFSPNGKSADGYLNRCKQCRRTQNLKAYHNTKHARKSRANADKPTSWIVPRDSRPLIDRTLDLALRNYRACNPAANLCWSIGLREVAA